MATDNEPMSDERLAEIRNRHERHAMDMTPAQAAFDIHRLLAEVDRLRAEVAAMREIVEAVAIRGTTRPDGSCVLNDFCGYVDNGDDDTPMRYEHALDCPVTKARALIAHPTKE